MWITLGGGNRIDFMSELGTGQDTDGRIRSGEEREIGLKEGIQGKTARTEGHLRDVWKSSAVDTPKICEWDSIEAFKLGDQEIPS